MAGSDGDEAAPQPAEGRRRRFSSWRPRWPWRRRPPWTLPAWLDHFNSRDLKILFRCWVAMWVATILVFIHPALLHIGTATFFASVVLFMVPPASTVFTYLLASLTLLLGMCVAWCWSLLVMVCGLAARPGHVTRAKLAKLKLLAAARAQRSGETVQWEAEALIHNGFMLDARVSAVMLSMGLVFVYVLARLRFYNRKFALFQILGTIIMDVVMTIGPTLPKFDGELPSILVKPAAIGIGLGAVCCLLIFPQSTAYVVLAKLERLVSLSELSLGSTRKHLANEKLQPAQLKAARGGIVAFYKATEPALAFLPLDFSRGRWSAEDVKKLTGFVRAVIVAACSLIDQTIARTVAVEKGERLVRQRAAQDDAEKAADADGHGVGYLQLRESADLIAAFTGPNDGAMRERAMQSLQGTTAEVLRMSSQSVKLAAQYIHTVNSCRWFGAPSQQRFDELARELQDTLTALSSAKATCVENTARVVLESHADLFDENGQLKLDGSLGPAPLRGVIAILAVEESILVMAAALEGLLGYIIELTGTRTAHRIWFPAGLRYAVTWLLNGRSSISVSGTSNQPDEDPDSIEQSPDDAFSDKANELRRRFRSGLARKGRPPRRSLLTRVIAFTFGWLFGPAGMFALRMVVASFATIIPAVIPHSAGFYFREKGLWAVISAQTCIVEYMVDFTSSLISRGLGTVFGGVMALLAWYIGSAHGPGNPYGMGASMAVFIVIMLWLRIFLPPQYALANIMAGATFALIIGFSYDDQHIREFGSPGRGYQAFWIRLVVVLLGFVAAAFVTLFPKPQSAAGHVRKTLAKTVHRLSDHYAVVLSEWPRAEHDSALRSVSNVVSLEVADTLLSLGGAINLLKIEPTFGVFDRQALGAVQQQCQYLNQCVARLLLLSTSLSKELRDRLVETCGILDDRVIGNVMAVLHIIEQSLHTGLPLPERLPVPLIRAFHDRWRVRSSSVAMNTTLLRDENYRRYCVAVSAYLRLLSTTDDLVLVLKDALGECHVVQLVEDGSIL